MSLYLGLFDGDEELDGWVLGHYSDFACFRETIAAKIPNASDLYPQLMQHSDCDGEWSRDALPILKTELDDIAQKFRGLSAETPEDAFEHAAEFRIGSQTLYDCFHNVDGENLFEAFIQLCEDAIAEAKPIVLQ